MGRTDEEIKKNQRWKFFRQRVKKRHGKRGQTYGIQKQPEYFVQDKFPGGIIKRTNDINNSSKQADKIHVLATDMQQQLSVGNGSNSLRSTALPRKIASLQKKIHAKQTTPMKSEVAHAPPPRTPKELAADVIRADCMVHGYRVGQTIGEGAYAKVKLAEVLPSKLVRNEQLADLAMVNGDGSLFVAIKVIDSKNVPKEFLRKFLPRELGNHCPLPQHENVVRVFEQFRIHDRYYVVMEYCSKGDLLDLINKRISDNCKGIGEELAQKLFTMMAEGVRHIHLNGIVHRDLKCENILVDQNDVIKITDFGFSTQYIPNKTSLLKTSCGSYAYTAPEVIKMKPYDGTKTDVWSLGIILFAMLNGRLPFNDAQLNDLEEEMKMQRLRFERNVSFESMVLVRRILQFNPANRPSVAELLTDPWLTGKRPIPRQVNKPKWISPYTVRRENGDPAEPGEVSTPPRYYKGTIPERSIEGTFTLNHDSCEKVVLKSRSGKKKNIWASGPPVSQRPKTWPRSDNAEGKTIKVLQGRRSSANERKKTNTTLVVRQPERRGKTPSHDTGDKNIKFSKWFMNKYMAGLEEFESFDPDENCRCCKAEAAMKKVVSNSKITSPNSSDHTSGSMDTFDDDSDLEDKGPPKFPNPVKNKSDVNQIVYVPSAKRYSALTDEEKNKIELLKELKSVVSTRKSAPPTRSHGIKPRFVRSAMEKTLQPLAITDLTASCRSTVGKPADTPKPKTSGYMMSKTATPLERVKYFRDRLMKIYGSDRAEHEISELPPLMVQSLKPSSGSVKSADENQSAPKVTTISQKPVTGNLLRIHCSTSGSKPRPVQRVTAHSTLR